MKMIFTKSSNSPNLLHIYEHVISARIHNNMRRAGYYCYADYALKARTFDSGNCFLDIELYDNNHSPALFGQNLSEITFDEADIQHAYLQVLAEESRVFGFLSPTNNLPDEMAAIHASDWSIAKINEIDSNMPNNDDGLLAYGNSIKINDYIIKLKIGLNALKPTLIEDVLKVIGHNIQVHISNEYGYYREFMEISADGINLGFRVLKSTVSIQRDLSYVKSMANELMRAKSFRRLFASLNQEEFDMLIANMGSSFEAWSADCLEIN